MTRKCRNYNLHTNTWHYEEDVLEHRHAHESENGINPGAFCNTFDLH